MYVCMRVYACVCVSAYARLPRSRSLVNALVYVICIYIYERNAGGWLAVHIYAGRFVSRDRVDLGGDLCV